MHTVFLGALLISPAVQPNSVPAAAPVASSSSNPWDPASRIEAQRKAMEALAFLDGAWRGGAEAQAGGGRLIQTERVGPILGGTVKLVEGRAYDAADRTVFNALGVISYDPVKRAYSMRAHAMGYAGDYPLEVRPDGFRWVQPMGPGASIRYTATIRNGEWHEIGERLEGSAPASKMFEMRLRRIGDTAWPASGAVPRQ